MRLALPLAPLAPTRGDWVARALMALGVLAIVAGLVLPLFVLGERAFLDRAGQWIGGGNFLAYVGNPALRIALWHSLWVSALATLIVVTLAFFAAWAVTRTAMPGRGLFRVVLFLPLLAPSLLAGLSLVYWFGAQGAAKGLLFGAPLYGAVGIVLGSCFWTLPHAFLILITAFANADGRVYEAARVLGASPFRVFRTVTLPSVRYGVVSAGFVVFTLVFTDFGVPKVIGGSYNMVATDIYKQVIGQQNFGMGAAISLMLLLPAVLSFFAERWASKRQDAGLGSRATRHVPAPGPWRDRCAAAYALLLSGLILAMIGMAFYASLVKYWPYDLSPTLAHYRFESVPGSGWRAFGNSLRLALYVACIGTACVFLWAYLTEKGRSLGALRGLFRFLVMLPLAIPGLVLGLGYVFFFNAPGNPLNALYGGMALLVLCTIVHFYSVAQLTAASAINQLDREFESASSMLRAPFWRLLGRVTLPVCLPAVLDVWFYLFVNAMTTVSAVIFLYSPDTMLASVAALNLDDSGETAGAAAMASLIVVACALVRLAHWAVSRYLLARMQRWRNP
ncbi:putative 2-aminoethylphosphonate ABC transporter permease subunit [Solimonas sp. K1W22B-7]|uniref:putative 2-aminoethylphosphonate ABC transporter permease subunit n=1 Tax=Solimonas sp. K1W22B-7 TaxID=2303331 RepID=UPI000E3313CA|nr:putative 2-aminoethylphosphonate ABC transporter permease subunit [Solimonas sp. K1W22B-7]AXQ28920.1 putative 2-aminoethylphosphonate ABC transporter permease subunit [Solimonas sp. K1W22B-7]